MSDAIRNVTVKINYEIAKSDLKVDTSQLNKAIDAASAKSTAATQAVLKDISAHTKAVFDLQKSQADTIAQEKAQARLAASARAAANEARKAQREQEAAAKSAAQELENQRKAQEQAAKAVEQANKQVLQSNLKTAEGFKLAGEGLFTMVRGAALLGGAGNKDMAKFVESIARVQGVFDLFKGATDIVKGVSIAIQGMRAAAAAGAVANAGLAASNAAVGASATAAAGGMTALQVATGPVGIAAIAVTAAVVGLVFWLNSLRESESKVAQIEEEAIRRRERLADATEALARASASAREVAGILDPVAAKANRQQALAGVGSAIDAAGSQRLDAQRREQEASDELLKLQSGKAAREKQFLGVRTGSADDRRRAVEFERTLDRKSVEEGKSEADVFAEAEARVAAAKKEVLSFDERLVQLAEEKKRLTQELANDDKRALDVRKQDLETQKQLVEETKREAAERRKTAEQLKNQQENLELAFGALKGSKRAQAEAIREKFKAGTATEKEARKFEELVGRTEESVSVLRAGAKSRGSEEFAGGLTPVGGTSSFAAGRADATRQAAAFEEAAFEQAEELRRRGEKLNSDMREVQNTLVTSFTDLTDLISTMNGRLSQQQEEISRLKARNENG
jgi:hypothetical protein